MAIRPSPPPQRPHSRTLHVLSHPIRPFRHQTSMAVNVCPLATSRKRAVPKTRLTPTQRYFLPFSPR